MQNTQPVSQELSTPLVSFIVTTYNLPSSYLRECLQSILQLSLNIKEREIILIDDGSDLCPLGDLLDLQDSILYLRQCNKGLSEARNIGLSIATGKYIQFVDGDDYLIRAPYEHCLDIARYHNPDIVYFEETQQEEVETPFFYNEPVCGSTYLHDNNLRASACGYLFRKDILHNLRFTTGILHEDEEFTPQLFLRADRIITTSSKAYFYRMRSDSLSQENNKRHKLQRLEDTERVILHLQEIADPLPDSDRKALQRRIAQLTMDYLYNIIVLTRSSRYLEDAIDRLHDKGLFPLPDKNYTKKYMMFRKAINTKLGRRILLLSLPRIL